MKCEICHKKLNQTFLGKPFGTSIKDKLGKTHWICNECQRKFKNNKEEILKNIE